MATHGRRLKRLTYRDQGNTSLELHTEHWVGFTWQSGPVIVASVGPWGCVKVWAANAEEGKRVIRHAAAIAGFDPDRDSGARWIVTLDKSGRSDAVRTYGTRVLKYGIAVTKRDGPDGFPEHASVV
jgi:hypothetical protein